MDVVLDMLRGKKRGFRGNELTESDESATVDRGRCELLAREITRRNGAGIVEKNGGEHL